VKRALLRLLDRVGLLGPAFRLYERGRAVGGPSQPRADGALPLPPRALMMKVAGTPDVEWFVRGGELAADSIREAVERHGGRLEDVRALLDFGCGSGRVMRHWAHLDGCARHGCDTNAAAIEWCRRNLAFARFEVNGAAPPLPYDDAQFELVYALSVLTHLPEELQRAWLDELRRILARGGLLLVSTHGDAYRERLDPDELRRYDAGEVVVRWSAAAGTNLCAAYHPVPALVRLAEAYTFVEHVPEGAKGNPRQDLTVLRKD
jgi:SAM-dependent methyltransferase